MDFLDQFADAVQRFEGWFAPGTPGYPKGSVAYRNNNPGNLRDAPARFARGNPPSVNGYVNFADYDTGRAALQNDLQAKINRGWNLFQLESVYAPAGDNNDPNSYARVVAGWLGIDPNAPLIGYTQDAPAGSLPDLSLPDVASDPIQFVVDAADEVSGLSDVGKIALGGSAVLLLAYLFS